MTDPPPALVEVTRGAFVEARHLGSLVVLDASGSVSVSAGAVDEPVLMRSSLKPLQAVAMIEQGLDLPPEWLALACASHDGEAAQLAGVRALLASAGLFEDDLQCPPALPSGEAALVSWVRDGGSAARICHNCSGKHAAMLATCRAADWPTESYLDPAHPLQGAVRAHLGELAEAPVASPTVDGCGAPAFAISLVTLARAFAALATADSGPESRVADAMRAHPELVSATSGAHVEISREVSGLVAKEGAEGAIAAALPDGRAFAAKFADGTGRGRGPLLSAVLRSWGFDDPAVRLWSSVDVLGGGRPVGRIRPSTELTALLDL